MNSPHGRTRSKQSKRRISSEQRLFLSVLVSAVPVIVLLFYVVVDAEMAFSIKVSISLVCLCWILFAALSIKENFVYHVRTLSNLVEAIRTEDYSMRSSRVRDPGELAELYQQINSLTSQLKDLRQREFEFSNLLERIINQINVAIIACDSTGRIRLANRLAKKLLDSEGETLIDSSIHDTVFADLLTGEGSKLVDFDFPGASGRWQVSEQPYRYEGKPGKVIFITDLKQVLNEEEIAAWQRLIRVIAHEVNNSMTPISSICQTLVTHLEKTASQPSQRDDQELKQGLSVIEDRAKGLGDFISTYARIAKLPEPQKTSFKVAGLLRKLRRYFSDQSVLISEIDDELSLFGDPVQIEQVLINLIKNAIEATRESDIAVEVSCRKQPGQIVFEILDQGTGIGNPANLFVPFYTTKEKGAGIGLTLCRQIAARHGGQVSLENRQGQPGAVARLQIPVTVNN